MSKEEISKSNRIFIVSLWIIPIVFYIVFWTLDGAVWCADSDSYVRMHDCREPLYPAVLALLRYLLGIGAEADPENNLSLIVMALLQSILAGVATASLTVYMTKTFLGESLFCDRLKGRKMYTSAGLDLCLCYGKKHRAMAYVLMAMPLIVSLLNRFVAGRGSMYSNSIMTEGITISLYMLAFRYILEYMIQGTGYSFRMSCLMVLIAINTRKQMYVLLCLLVLALVYRELHHRMAGRRNMARSADGSKNRAPGMGCIVMGGLAKILLTVAVITGINLLIDCSYNLIVRDSFTIHTEDNRFLTTMAMYTSEREYVEYIEPELKDIYLKIYDECDAHKWLMHDAPTTWRKAVAHFAGNYDHIQLDTMQIMLEYYVESHNYSGFKEGMLKTEKIDVIRASFNRSLFPHESERLARVFVYNFLNGLVDTVARDKFILCIYAALIYLVYICLIISSLVKYRRIGRSDECVTGADGDYIYDRYRKAVILSTITLLSILGNVTLISSVIFCQVRYTIYNMPLFYMTLAVLIYYYLDDRRIRRGK